MFRTLTWKLILAFLAVSLTVALLGALIARWLTIREFNQLVLEQAENRFITDVSLYYQLNGSWNGVFEFINQRRQPVGGADGGAQPPALPPGSSNPAPVVRKPLVFLLVDAQGEVVIPADGYRIGDQFPASLLEEATPVQVEGDVVGYAMPSGELPSPDLREQQYMKRTNRALALATLGATLVALLLGVLLARALSRPLRELTGAIRAMGEGELQQEVPVRSQDELGALAQAFNQMSADLAQADQARRRLTADIAHDLRTPLTVIAGYVEALREGVLPPSAERFQAIQTEVNHLQRLVEDLRTLTLADAGELRLMPEPTSPRQLLERIHTAFEAQAVSQGIHLQVRASDDLPQVHLDVERIAQVLGNLVTNSLRHTPQGGRITLSAEIADGMLSLIVEDNGEGIPSEALGHIFDRFYRVQAARPGGRGETGLGLAIAKSIVEAHGGSIQVESQPGEGTRFTIRLPV